MNDTSYKIDPPKSSKGGSLKRNGYFRSKIATALMGKILLYQYSKILSMKRENSMLSLYPTPVPII